MAIVANSEKVSSRGVLRKAASLIRRSGRTVITDRATAALANLEIETCPGVLELSRGADLLMVFGGDGTMLRVAREMNGSPTPVIGVNIGGLGFLTAVPSLEIAAALDRVWAGDFHLESRSLIQARGRTGDQPINLCALNDLVISRGIISRLIELEVTVDGEILTRYRCDGLIVSSPTGSTAYSLAAGGAVVCPTAKVFAITPICPHTLSNRSVIVDLDSRIEVTIISEKHEIILSADGQGQTHLAAGDRIRIQRSRNRVRLVRLEGSSFFQTLRHKLNWTGSNIISR